MSNATFCQAPSVQRDKKPYILLLQYAAQVPELQKAGIATVAFDYLGCGRSEKPDDFTAYAAQQLYQDLVAVFDRCSQVKPKPHPRLSRPYI